MKFYLYGHHDGASISLDRLLGMQRNEGMFWAHAEDSGSESCYCEVAHWNEGTRRYERFAFAQCADYRFPELPAATDEVTAKHTARLINDLIPCNMRLPIVHRMPDSGSAAIEYPLPDGTRITEVLKDDDLDCGGTVGRLKESAGRLIDACMEPPVAVFKIEGDARWWAASVELFIGPAAPEMLAELLVEHDAEPETGSGGKAIRCSVCGLLVECDGDPGPLGAIRIPGNHEAIECDGFATPTELPVCPGSEQNGIVEAAN